MCSRNIFYLSLFALIICSYSCTNPFAPKLAEDIQSSTIISDQRTVDGIFQNFRYAYRVKDTLVYGRLLSPNFTFIYRNYDKAIDIALSRDEDMRTTSGLFSSTQSLDLIWNSVIIGFGDSLNQEVSRGFSLTITFSQEDVVRIDGRVALTLVRNNTSEPWLIKQWRDESNY